MVKFQFYITYSNVHLKRSLFIFSIICNLAIHWLWIACLRFIYLRSRCQRDIWIIFIQFTNIITIIRNRPTYSWRWFWLWIICIRFQNTFWCYSWVSTKFPTTFLNDTFFCMVLTLPMLFSIFPLSFKLSTIWPNIYSESVFLIVFVIASITSTITPWESALTFHYIIFPLAFIKLFINPPISSLTLYIIFKKFTYILSFLWPYKFAYSSFLSSYIITFKNSSITPTFSSFTML